MDAVESRGLAGGGEALVRDLDATRACRGPRPRPRTFGAASISGKSIPWSGLVPSAASCSSRAATACAPSSPKSCFARSAIGSRRTTPFFVSMTRPSHLGSSMPSGCAKRRTTSKTSVKPLALPRDEPSSSSSSSDGSSSSPSSLASFGRFAIRALERPEEERREPRVLLDGAGRAVAGLGLGGAEHLREGAAAHDLPDLLQVLGERDLAPVGGLDLRVAAEDLERRADAGEDEVGAADAFALQALHPVADARRQLAQDVGPVADRRVVGTRAADEVDAGGEARGFAGAQPSSPSQSRSATSR